MSQPYCLALNKLMITNFENTLHYLYSNLTQRIDNYE